MPVSRCSYREDPGEHAAAGLMLMFYFQRFAFNSYGRTAAALRVGSLIRQRTHKQKRAHRDLERGTGKG